MKTRSIAYFWVLGIVMAGFVCCGAAFAQSQVKTNNNPYASGNNNVKTIHKVQSPSTGAQWHSSGSSSMYNYNSHNSQWSGGSNHSNIDMPANATQEWKKTKQQVNP